ncbi:hypothetical protein U9M48_036134 [Paspalum notatum var. saurae]|uniref:Integrase catalytic domain-containing protein n=1 Tax=Paspalum notatum var. saurae TaxID=547442 RepID=A0AAQ3X970_PASNO
MDSGCSRHITGHRKWFSSLNPVSTKEYITFGDNGQGKVLGVGSVLLSAKLSLREVAFVRNLGFNLVSVSQLLDEGFEVHFKKGACCVLDAEGTLVCSLLPFGQVFRVDLTSVSGPARCLVASPLADIWKWYRRLGHLSFDLLVRLSSMGLIRGLPKLRAEKDLVCHPCRHGKKVAASHIPVCQDLVLRLRNESHKAVRAIRSDNGGEFRNSRFENFCRDLGLEHQFSSPYTPPQNGVVECKNRTLVEMARTMLDEHRTPRRFWAEAVSTACYIANRIFLRAFLGKTSYELRFGYASSSRAFRVWVLEAKQVVEVCEVSFDETMPCTTPVFELSGDDEEGTPIFEDEEGAVDDGDVGATAPAAAPAPSTTSCDDDGGPLPTASSSLPRQQAHVEAGPAEDAGEVTSEIVPSQQDVSHALSDSNWVNAMHEELENFERNHVWDLVEPPPNCCPIGTKWVFKNKQEEEVYVRQPPGFESARFPDRVYKLRKAFYALDADEDGEAVDQKEFHGMIGLLLYLTATRPDIQFAVCLCARYQASPRTSHRQAVKRIFRYLKFTTELGLWYSSGSSLSLRGFLDADHAGCRIDRKSTSGTCQLLGTSLVSWSSHKQASVALSTTEAEYVAAASYCSQLLWMKATLSDFGLKLQVEGVDNALIKGEIESQWTGLIALLV